MRALAALLLLANALFFAWSQGWLDGVAGVRAHGDREPERLAQQVRPEGIRVLTPQAAAALAAAAAAAAASSASAPAAPAASGVAPAGSSASAAFSAAAALACLEAGPFTATEFPAAVAALKAALPNSIWADVPASRGGVWVIYMGKYANREAQLKKEEELQRIKVAFEELSAPPNLGPGLSLGRFDNQAAANAGLAQLARRGIRTARIVELTPPVVSHLLRIERADAAFAQRVSAIRSPALGRGFGACKA